MLALQIEPSYAHAHRCESILGQIEMPLASYTIPVDVAGFILRLIHRRPFVFPCQPSSTGNGISNRFDVESRWNYRILNKLPGNRNGSSRVPSSRTVQEHGQVISLEWCFVDWSLSRIGLRIQLNYRWVVDDIFVNKLKLAEIYIQRKNLTK